MGETSSPDRAVADPLDEFLRSKSKGGGESGNYRRNLERVVQMFLDWLERDSLSDGTFEDLDARTLRRFARDLANYDADSRNPVRQKNLAPSTIQTYYAQVSAYIGWCVREGLLDQNVAQLHVAKEPLPEDDGRRSGDKQAWTDEHRQRITRYVDRLVDEALDELGDGSDDVDDDERSLLDAVQEYRDRAIVYVLTYTGVRGGEVFADPKDDRRDGLRWGDVALEDNKMTVLAKKQNWSDRSVPQQAVAPIARYERVLQPTSDEWPVFPTMHLPTLYGTLRDGFAREEGHGSYADAPASVQEDIDARLEEVSGRTAVFELLREHDIAPPSINTDGARRVMKRLSEAADLDLDDEHGYLAPHGGRRGVGEVLVRQRGFTAAARQLDNSEEVVREAYSHIEASELAKSVGDAFDDHDNRNDS